MDHKRASKRLLAKLNSDWMRAICAFALMTGARRTEILTMTWDKIDWWRKVAIVTNDVANQVKHDHHQATKQSYCLS